MWHRHDAGPGWMFEMPVTPARPHVLPTGRLDFPDHDAAIHGGRIYTLVHTAASVRRILDLRVSPFSGSCWGEPGSADLPPPPRHVDHEVGGDPPSLRGC